MKKLLLICALASQLVLGHTFEIGETDFLLDGKRLQIRCGEIHAARVPAAYWRQRLQMCKAMGLNTVCAYLFWNQHEPTPGKFNWEGQADAAQFCRIAQEEGLWVILRPGPYSCAEWEMGGTPWWLLKNDNITLRTRDPKYLEPAKAYLKEMGRILAPLQVTRGGPILMVQVENEYGFYGSDAAYMGEIRQALIDAGFDVPLFDCNPAGQLKNGKRDDLFHVVNFGSDPKYGFERLREIQPKGPLMCGEFYPGWFDTWGQPHHVGAIDTYLRDLEIMLKMNASFSIYMAHGGTTFGFWPGCDAPFRPDTSSYDYSAPISEAGWVTEKFTKTRELFAKYLLPGETFPEPPAANPVMTFKPVLAQASASLFDNLPTPRREETPRNMEAYDQGFGCILYRTKIPAGSNTQLRATGARDFGYVYLNQKLIGIMDRRFPGRTAALTVPARDKEAQLDILVEPMGRVNFGQGMLDRKGLTAPVTLGGTELKGWEVFNLPMNNVEQLKYNPIIVLGAYEMPSTPAFWRVTVDIENPADTFLDLSDWGKGMVWINGTPLARFWNIGPTQTAYVPGCWLKKGQNTFIIWSIIPPSNLTLSSTKTPVLDKLRPECDFTQLKRPEVTWHLGSPAKTGAFAEGKDVQTVQFDKPVKGRQVCIETTSSYQGHDYAAIAELDFLDANGQPINHDGWTVAAITSEEILASDGSAENALDGQTANYWHSKWYKGAPKHPHRLAVDLGAVQTISGIRYVPRQDDSRGWIKDYNVYVGDELVKPVR